jgi:hypothetical protein
MLNLDGASGAATRLPQVHAFDSSALTPIVAAAPGTTGATNDAANEIHLACEGYRKVGLQCGPSSQRNLPARAL